MLQTCFHGGGAIHQCCNQNVYAIYLITSKQRNLLGWDLADIIQLRKAHTSLNYNMMSLTKHMVTL